MDYSKPFRLFDEDGSGTVPIDEFRRMLYRLNVDTLLRENQVIELMNRFDTNRSGECKSHNLLQNRKLKHSSQRMSCMTCFCVGRALMTCTWSQNVYVHDRRISHSALVVRACLQLLMCRAACGIWPVTALRRLHHRG
jgi:hypothetical protein